MKTLYAIRKHAALSLVCCLLIGLVTSCKTVKLKDAEEKQQLGEYYAAAEMYRKLYTSRSPTRRTCALTSLTAWDTATSA